MLRKTKSVSRPLETSTSFRLDNKYINAIHQISDEMEWFDETTIQKAIDALIEKHCLSESIKGLAVPQSKPENIFYFDRGSHIAVFDNVDLVSCLPNDFITFIDTFSHDTVDKEGFYETFMVKLDEIYLGYRHLMDGVVADNLSTIEGPYINPEQAIDTDHDCQRQVTIIVFIKTTIGSGIEFKVNDSTFIFDATEDRAVIFPSHWTCSWKLLQQNQSPSNVTYYRCFDSVPSE